MSEENIPIGLHPINFKPYKVMIAEDSTIDRSLLRRYLQSERFEILYESTNGDDLLFYLKESINKPDLICIDINMPNKNGIEVIQEIRKTYTSMKVAVISASTDKAVIQNLLQLKIDAFVKKPYNRTQILQKLSIALGRQEEQSKESTVNNLNLGNLVIPPLPAVAIKVSTFDSSNPTGGSEELERIIGPDKSITTDIMKIANSAFYARSGRVHTLKDAITLLGMKTVKNLVLLQANKQFTHNLQGEVYQKNLQELPILSALIAYDLTVPLGMKNFKDDAFLASLLRKIGMTILALNYLEKYTDVIDLSNSNGKDLITLEREAFQIDHVEIGTKVFKSWNMPKGLQDVVSHQNFLVEEVHKVSHIDKITRLAGCLAYQMLGYELKVEEKEIEETIFNFYNAPNEVRESFQKDYYDMIKDHPFFDMLN